MNIDPLLRKVISFVKDRIKNPTATDEAVQTAADILNNIYISQNVEEGVEITCDHVNFEFSVDINKYGRIQYVFIETLDMNPIHQSFERDHSWVEWENDS